MRWQECSTKTECQVEKEEESGKKKKIQIRESRKNTQTSHITKTQPNTIHANIQAKPQHRKHRAAALMYTLTLCQGVS